MTLRQYINYDLININLISNDLTSKTFCSDDVVVLCASGTAVIVDLSYMLDLESVGTFGPPFIPCNANHLGAYGIGGQPPAGRRPQDVIAYERSYSDGHEV